MNELGPAAISGVVTDGVTRSETQRGAPVATFSVQVSRQWAGPVDLNGQSVWCRAAAYPANSAYKYVYTGARVVIVGRLHSWNVPAADGPDELYINVELIAYLSPREIVEAAKIRGRAL